jgi:hypothetical protein
MTSHQSALRRSSLPARALIVAMVLFTILLATAVIFIHRTVSSGPDMTSATVGRLHYSIENAWLLDPGRSVEAGLTKGLSASGSDGRRVLYGVFLGVTNETARPLRMASDITLRDVYNREYRPVPLPRDNEFAYRAGAMAPQTHRPAPSSPAGRYLDADGLLLAFRIPRSAYEAGSLELVLHDPEHPASVSTIMAR